MKKQDKHNAISEAKKNFIVSSSKNTFGPQKSPLTLYKASDDGQSYNKVFSPQFMKYCANEDCTIHQNGISSAQKFKCCKKCGTMFCSDECHVHAWKNKYNHFTYCKLINKWYDKMLEIKNTKQNSLFMYDGLIQEIQIYKKSKEYADEMKNIGLDEEKAEGYLQNFIDKLSYD